MSSPAKGYSSEVDEPPFDALHVALLLPTLTGGGAERVTLNLIEGLTELGCRVDLVLFTATGALSDAVPRSTTVVDLECGRALRSPLPLAHYMRSKRPDVMIAAMGHANLAALLARKLAGVPTRLVLTEHLAVSPTPQGIKDRIYRNLARIAYPYAEAVVAVSRGVADSLVAGVALREGSVTVIFNPVLARQYWQAIEAPVEHPWFEPKCPPVILGVGRLVAQKAFPVLIKAFAQVLQERSARLIILGEGPDRPSLEALVEELGLENSVSIPGFVNNPVSYMSSSDVFVLSSVREGLPTVLIEALATGIPVVSTNCESGPYEILQGGALGRLVPVGDIEALSTAIIAALDDPVQRLGADILKEYLPKTAAKRYLEAAGFVE